jgi:hypothetical protein
MRLRQDVRPSLGLKPGFWQALQLLGISLQTN